MEFIVEDGIPDAVEVAYDGYTIDGKFAKNATFGIEVKDKGLVSESPQVRRLARTGALGERAKLRGTLAESGPVSQLLRRRKCVSPRTARPT